MSIRLYMDAHIPAAITHGLRLRGVDVLTSQEDLTDHWDDAALVDRATELDRVLFSMDADLRQEAGLRQRDGKFFSGIIAAEQLRISVGLAVEQLELIAKVYEPPDMQNQIEYLPLK